MQCTKCGAPLHPSSKFCPSCGTPVAMQQPYYPMPNNRNNTNVVLIVVIAVLAVIIVGIAAYFLISRVGSSKTAEDGVVHDTVVVQETIEKTIPTVITTTGSLNNTATAKKAPAQYASGGDYSWICNTRLSRSDVAGKSKSELRIMRNTIYARHGYIFKSNDLTAYFSRFSWYSPYRTVVPSSQLSSIEQYNINLIQQYE